MHRGALTRSLLPDIAPLRAGLFSTPTGLLAFTDLPYFHILLSIEPLLADLFDTMIGLLRIMILSIWKSVGTRAC